MLQIRIELEALHLERRALHDVTPKDLTEGEAARLRAIIDQERALSDEYLAINSGASYVPEPCPEAAAKKR
jgi:hypothetical protein